MRKSLSFVTALLVAICMFFSCENTPAYTAPEVTTAEISEITDTSAQCGGIITDDGGATVTARGVCWSTSLTPTISDNKTDNGTGEGNFTSSITGLTAATIYYVRAYATNNEGTGYGSVVYFITTKEGYEIGTVTDIDGNVYPTVKIGDQWWMAENLKVTHYQNGSLIPNIAADTAWENLTTGAYCYYDNDENNVDTYGRLYNWYAVTDSRNIAPEGWHVPSDEEWKILEMYLGLSQSEADATGDRGTDEGGKLKETGTEHWASPNTGATNESGFSALPGGARSYAGPYEYMRIYGGFWLSTQGGSVAWTRSLAYNHSRIHRYTNLRRTGFSVRCVRD